MWASGVAPELFALPSPLAPTVFVVKPWISKSDTSVATHTPIMR